MSTFSGKHINTEGHFAVGSVWTMVSGKKKELGRVEMRSEGFECSCGSNKRCNHIRGVEQKLSNGSSFLARCIG